MPPGFRIETRSNRTLRTGGYAVFLVGYFASAIGGSIGYGIAQSQVAAEGYACTSSFWWASIPIVGAAIAAAEYPHHLVIDSASGRLYACQSNVALLDAAAITVTALQGLGLLMMVSSAFVHSRFLVEGTTVARRTRSNSISIVPINGPTPLGAGVLVAF